MPEDNEELALNLNGKKRKITRSDFEQVMIASGVDSKVIDNIFNKFIKYLAKWEEMIDIKQKMGAPKYSHYIITSLLYYFSKSCITSLKYPNYVE